MRVAILGCGYIGLELGRQLTARGHDVVGVRRSPEGCEAIEEAGFQSVRADVTDRDALAGVPDADALVFAASSGGRGAEAAREVYVRGLETAIGHFAGRADPPERLLYTSSTGVYGDHGGEWVDEETPTEPATEKTRVLWEAEETALDSPIPGTVVRFAGLYGPDRYRLERYLEGPVTEGYLNMVHREDAAGAVRYLLEENLARGEVVLAVDDEPVDKWAFADWLAEQCGVPEPPKETKEERLSDPNLSEPARRRLETSKRCSNAKLRELGYEFSYPTFREGYREAVAAYPRR
ncbi:SDR family oxidoreductase [Halalkalicoccus sp. NIPERK01]|uniref:SDR family oxidoreductase n=1 Tax=Halalkalicoccus sp. NIPERK01 TaxID=3053469 RepID=UPI00256F1165|nr:SDR family oxidoreductase [Halalkalicoccus sp. NIPERK01]MDL5361930.1 SDR family oxidoreductase [Halalkalicoccus sp. NIPERK01]